MDTLLSTKIYWWEDARSMCTESHSPMRHLRRRKPVIPFCSEQSAAMSVSPTGIRSSHPRDRRPVFWRSARAWSFMQISVRRFFLMNCPEHVHWRRSWQREALISWLCVSWRVVCTSVTARRSRRTALRKPLIHLHMTRTRSAVLQSGALMLPWRETKRSAASIRQTFWILPDSGEAWWLRLPGTIRR